MIRSHRATLLVILVFVASGALWLRAADEKPAVAAPDGKMRVFEMRTYHAAPGKMDALHARFRDHTLRLFEKHGIKSIGYWTGADDVQRQKLYYIVAYPDRPAREQRLGNGIAKDAEFLKAVAESEKDGKLTTEIESVLLSPTDYSAMR